MPELRTLRALVDELCEHGDQPAILALREEEVECWSFAELADRTRRLMRGLVSTGVDRGDHVALLAGNRPEWVAACLAVIEAGAVVVPLDAELGDEALGRVLEDSGAKLVFTTAEQTGRLERLDTEAAPRPVLLDVGGENARKAARKARTRRLWALSRCRRCPRKTGPC